MENRKRLYMLIGLIALLSLMVVLPVMASEVQSLRGIKEFAVFIDRLPPAIEKEGFNKNTIQIDVELKLRLAGIKVITLEERLTVPGHPYLYVNVCPIKHNSSGYAYSIHVEFRQNVILIRNYMETSATTWDDLNLGFTPKSAYDAFRTIRGNIKDRIDEFINDYLSVNPK